jgi:hypothetical protein
MKSSQRMNTQEIVAILVKNDPDDRTTFPMPSLRDNFSEVAILHHHASTSILIILYLTFELFHASSLVGVHR